MSQKILVTGGAGYIGSHLVEALASNKEVIVLDNLQTGFIEAIPPTAKFILGDIKDKALLDTIMQEEKIETVMHLAASTLIPESLQYPGKYFENNAFGTLNLLEACVKHQVKYFIFSSTAAVYSASSSEKLKEDAPKAPQNPYGQSKLMAEEMIQAYAKAFGLKHVILRYFNVAGASQSGKLGQRNTHANHLITVAVQTACGLRQNLPIFGVDYPTQDGTCVRDFIHVSDLANAHIEALHYLQKGGQPTTLNCGYGQGYSVKEVIVALEELIGKPLPVSIAPRRTGDLPQVIADTDAISKTLHWKPQFQALNLIIESALNWEKRKIQNLS